MYSYIVLNSNVRYKNSKVVVKDNPKINISQDTSIKTTWE